MDASASTDDEQYYNYAQDETDKRFFQNNNYDESITGMSSASTCTDDANYEPEQTSFDSYNNFERSQNYITSDDDNATYYSEGGGSWLGDTDDEDYSLGFPPGYATTLEQMYELQSISSSGGSVSSSSNDTNKSNSSDDDDDDDDISKKNSVNPSIIPSYFFCPLTETIMRDPVITPDGTTFERRAILRWLILRPYNPVTEMPLSHTDLVDDCLVRTSIDKARKEAWVKYVVEFRDDDAENLYEEKVVKKQKQKLSEIDSSLPLDAITVEEMERPLTLQGKGPQATPSEEISVSTASPTLNTGFDIETNHGWVVPLGVHKIVCSSHGLVVTSDVHRGSNVVKRRMLKKSLAGGKVMEKKKKKSIKKRIGKAVSPRKHRKNKNEYERRLENIKTATTAITQDLVLKSGTFVEITETRIHDGRVRGKVCWEEEVMVELDADLTKEIKRQERIAELMTEAGVSPSKKKSIFRRRQEKKGGAGADDDDEAIAQTISYSSNFSSDEIPTPSKLNQLENRSPSPSPATTIKYIGWISLQWAGIVGNHERDEAMKRRRDARRTLNVDVLADEDDGPWSLPLHLGVYRIDEDGLTVFETLDANSISIATLFSGDVVEVVETQVVMMKSRVNQSGVHLSMLASEIECIRTVRARCLVFAPDGDSKKKISGWITLCEEGKSDTASPIPVGAYNVSSKEPLMSYSGSKIKTILPSGSCMEVNATRLEFDECNATKCDYGQENAYPVVAVKALISLGGYATLFTRPLGCGKEVLMEEHHLAEPVALGIYKVVHPDGVFFTEGIGPNSQVITTISQNACVEVVETRVEQGCVRGKISIFYSYDVSESGDKKTGWISLFEPPTFIWAELVSDNT